MKKHFVTFVSPGTFTAESTSRDIEEWDIKIAINMSNEIEERHGALPYGFYFTTRSRGDGDLDSTEIARSDMYYLGGTILTLDDIKNRNDPNDRILISNMEGNHWDRVIENNNSWKWTQPLNQNDIVLDV